MTTNIALYNGEYCSENDIKLSIHDRGFKYGDGAFETIKTVQGIPQNIILHIERLAQTCEILMFTNYSKYIKENLLSQIIFDLSNKNNITDGLIRITIWRCKGGIGYLPTNSNVNVLVQILNYPPIPQNNKIMISSYERVFSQSLPIYGKTANSIQFILTKIEAHNNGCLDAIMLNRDGFICETSSANIFWKRGNVFYTPSPECGIINGITRQVLIAQNRDNVIQGAFGVNSLLSADEIFITNTSLGVFNVILSVS